MAAGRGERDRPGVPLTTSFAGSPCAAGGEIATNSKENGAEAPQISLSTTRRYLTGDNRPAVYIVLSNTIRGRRVAQIEAHITGTVWKIEVAVGDAVAEGDSVVIL